MSSSKTLAGRFTFNIMKKNTSNENQKTILIAYILFLKYSLRPKKKVVMGYVQVKLFQL